MKAEVLKLGCNKCNRLAGLAREVIDEIGLRCSLAKVSDTNRMIELGTDALPALVHHFRGTFDDEQLPRVHE